MQLNACMDVYYFAFIAIGAFAGGFVTGLAGFGTGLTALIFWLFVLPPPVAATLVIVSSMASQLQSLPTIWRNVEPKRLLPFTIPGLIGIPAGTVLLSYVDVDGFKLFIGILLVVYTSRSLIVRAPQPIKWGGKIADGVSGLCGGVLGGLAGLSGPIPTMWVNMRGWPNAQKRSVIQSFNLTILVVALVAHLIGGFVTKELLIAAAVALPVAALGTWLGVRAYGRISDRQFTNVILFVLGVSGVMLIWTNVV